MAVATARHLSYSTTLAFLLLCIIVSFSEARVFMVGGRPDAWISSSMQSLNSWAESSRFQVGDFLNFTLAGNGESAVQVTREDYHNCSASKPIAAYDSSNSSAVKLDRSGSHYFISDNSARCTEGRKLLVVVMSERWRLGGLHAVSPTSAPLMPPTSAALEPSTAPAEAVAPMTGDAQRLDRICSSVVVLLLVVLGWTFFDLI